MWSVWSVSLLSGLVALETEIVSVSFPGWHVVSTVTRPYLGHCQLLSLVSLYSWDLTPLIFRMKSDFERGV